jgi:hypothetical protein
VLALGLVAAGGLAFVAGRDREPPPTSAERAERPALMLLTTLPLIFGEGFGLDGGGSPALQALEKRYRVVPISVTDPAELKQARLLFMAHPLAQPAEALVALDQWVREGGRLLLLADPALDWHSDRRFGDSLRPPPGFADTGLLAHWGLRLDMPDERGPKQRELGGFPILTGSPGDLAGKCAISGDGLVARCRIGRGAATIVADADFLNVDDLDGPTERNLDALLAELASLERR